MRFHPDNLIEDRRYRVAHRDCDGRSVVWKATFLRMEAERLEMIRGTEVESVPVLWIWFRTDMEWGKDGLDGGYDVPIEAEAIIGVDEL